MSVGLANSTYAFIRKKVRRLTASASSASLSDADLDEYIQNAYENDFPYAIKIDQTRSVYKLFTIPNVDRYPTDINSNQGYRGPIYIEGIQGAFFKDRQQFFNLYPRYPTLMQPVGGDGVTKAFSFNLFGQASSPYPQPNFGILSTSVVVGGVDTNGDPIRLTDDGGAVVTPDSLGSTSGIGNNTTIGQLIQIKTNQVGNNVYLDAFNVQQPAIPDLSPLPVPAPMFASPTTPAVGTVNYVTSAFSFTLPVAPAAGTMLTVWCNQYVTGRPYSVLFWNNEITIRPVPDSVYCIEIETYLTPTQFVSLTETPALRQWSQYIAYIAAREILRDRQDMEGVENLKEGFDRQEALVLERQSIEDIFQPNITLFNSTSYGTGSGNYGWGGF